MHVVFCLAAALAANPTASGNSSLTCNTTREACEVWRQRLLKDEKLIVGECHPRDADKVQPTFPQGRRG
jgi:hypothetical protein